MLFSVFFLYDLIGAEAKEARKKASEKAKEKVKKIRSQTKEAVKSHWFFSLNLCIYFRASQVLNLEIWLCGPGD